MLHNHEGPTEHDSFMTPDSCTDQWCIDLYYHGPFYGRLVTERLAFLREELEERPEGPLMMAFPELELEADALEWAVASFESQVGPEWEDRLYGDESDEDWIREDFLSSEDDQITKVGLVTISCNEFQVWR